MNFRDYAALMSDKREAEGSRIDPTMTGIAGALKGVALWIFAVGVGVGLVIAGVIYGIARWVR